MELEKIPEITEYCIHDEAAPCAGVCPFGLDVRSFMKKLAKGRMPSAYKEFRTAVMFPKVVSELCDRPCLKVCQRAKIGDEPLDMERLEKAVMSLTAAAPPDVFQIPVKEDRIAVIGAGVTGLSLALNMAQKKYPVTVFEKGNGMGGRLAERPDFNMYLEDIKFQIGEEKIEFCFGKEIRSLDELAEYKAVYIATGRDGKSFGLRDSWDKELYTTARPLVFMAGEVCGQTMMEGIAAGRKVSMLMEGAMQTGRVIAPAAVKQCEKYDLVPKGAEPAAHVVPADAETGYTKAEVKEEAARCFLCNCDKCLKGCELMKKYGKPPKQLANEVAADLGPHFLASRTTTRQSYSCNQCGWCESVCPENVNMGEVFHISRTERVEKEIQPVALHDFWMRELEFVSGEAFYASMPKEGEKFEYAFFPGCRLGGELPEQTKRAASWMMENYHAGVVLGCCGAGAWWAGERERWEENSAKILDSWEKMGRPVFVTACATCMDMFAKLMPDIPVKSVYELLAESGEKAEKLFETAAVFDPCSARKNDIVRRSVRTIAGASGCTVTELEETGKCCGFGGHMRTANPELYDTVADNRVSMSELPYIVYCANCREVFLEKGKPCRHILEGYFGTEDRSFTLQEKMDNRLRLKNEIMQQMEGQTYMPEKKEWENLQIRVSEEVRAEMEQQLITDGDVKECIWRARNGGGEFVSDAGTSLACLVRKVMTYWVEYKMDADICELVSVYCHRMRILEGEA